MKWDHTLHLRMFWRWIHWTDVNLFGVVSNLGVVFLYFNFLCYELILYNNLSQKRCWWWPVFHFAFTGTKKKLDIIPVLIDDGYRDNIPRSMSHFYYLDYKRLEKELFWNKLAISLGWKPPNHYWERRVTNSAMDVRLNCAPTPPLTQQLSTEYILGLMLD